MSFNGKFINRILKSKNKGVYILIMYVGYLCMLSVLFCFFSVHIGVKGFPLVIIIKSHKRKLGEFTKKSIGFNMTYMLKQRTKNFVWLFVKGT